MISGNGKAIYIVTSKRAIAGIELQYLKWPSSILLSNYFPKKKKKYFMMYVWEIERQQTKMYEKLELHST